MLTIISLLSGYISFLLKNVKKTIETADKIMSVKLVFRFKLDEEKTLGINKNMQRFKIPPDKYKRPWYCKISINKKIKDALFERIFFW